ncbi:hypothetical protein C349_02790, partial [Cryptococcus neoformans var. grubii Br795]
MGRPAYLQDANPGKILRHQLDGSCYQVDDQDVQRERGCLVLTINVSIDWADPSKSRNRSPRSMGPIMCQLADLPNKYRSQYSFAMLMGITPAPNEPPGCLLHRLLLPLAVDLLSAECDGLWIRTPKYPNGEIPLSDARYMLGLEPFAAIGLPLSPSVDALILGGRTHLVSKCLVRVGQLHSTRKHPARSGVEHSEAMLAQQLEFLRQFEQAPQTARQTHVARRAGQLSKATQAHIEALEKSIFTVPGHLSAFDLFPNFDKILHAVVDPMHALLEGILPFYVRKVLVLGRYCALPPTGWAADEDAVSLCSTDSEGEAIVDGDGLREVYDQMMEQSGSSEDPRAIERLQRYAARVLPRSKTDGKPILAQALLYRLESMMEEVIYPPYINRIGKKFFTKLSFFSDLEPLGGDDGESGFRKKVLPQSSDGLGSILEIRHLKAKWTGALTLLHSSQNNGANRVPLPCPECKADEALEPEAREKLYLPASMLKHRLQNHLLEHRMRDHFGKNDQGKV